MAEWIRVGPAAPGRVALRARRAVLVLVHSVAAANRLDDVLPVFDGDHRVRLTFAVPYDCCCGVAFSGAVLPWEQAVGREWELVVSTRWDGIEQVHGNLLMLPDRADARKYRMCRAVSAYRERTAVALHTENDLLGTRWPEAFVAGDPCLDRLSASRGLRAGYRAALGVGRTERLVVLSDPELAERLTAELPAVRVVVLSAVRGWQGAVLAADVVLGDYGPTTAYALATGTRALFASMPADTPWPGLVPVLDHTRPLPEQLERAVAAPRFASLLSSRPGEAHARLREAAYRLLRMPEPGWPAAPGYVPAPKPLGSIEVDRWARRPA